MLAIPPPFARGALDEHVAEELHFNLLKARATAAVALAHGGVEAEGAAVQTALLSEFRSGEEVAEVVEGADVNGWVGARGFAEGALVNEDGAAQMLDAGQGKGRRGMGDRRWGFGGRVVGFALGFRVVGGLGSGLEFGLERGQQAVTNEGGLAGTAHARETDEAAQRDGNGEVLEVVGGSTGEGEKVGR